MKQTAVELLIEQIKSKADNLPTNTKENRMAKGIYVDCLMMVKQAKEMEEQQQGYSEEEVENILIEYVKTNPTKPYRVISWFREFKNK